MNFTLQKSTKKIFLGPLDLLMLLEFVYYIIVGNHEFSILVNLWHNDILDFFFKNLTYLGDGIFLFLIAFVFIFFKRKFAILTLSSLSITTIIVQFLKRIIFQDNYVQVRFFNI